MNPSVAAQAALYSQVTPFKGTGAPITALSKNLDLTAKIGIEKKKAEADKTKDAASNLKAVAYPDVYASHAKEVFDPITALNKEVSDAQTSNDPIKIAAVSAKVNAQMPILKERALKSNFIGKELAQFDAIDDKDLKENIDPAAIELRKKVATMPIDDAYKAIQAAGGSLVKRRPLDYAPAIFDIADKIAIFKPETTPVKTQDANGNWVTVNTREADPEATKKNSQLIVSTASRNPAVAAWIDKEVATHFTDDPIFKARLTGTPEEQALAAEAVNDFAVEMLTEQSLAQAQNKEKKKWSTTMGATDNASRDFSLTVGGGATQNGIRIGDPTPVDKNIFEKVVQDHNASNTLYNKIHKNDKDFSPLPTNYTKEQVASWFPKADANKPSEYYSVGTLKSNTSVKKILLPIPVGDKRPGSEVIVSGFTKVGKNMYITYTYTGDSKKTETKLMDKQMAADAGTKLGVDITKFGESKGVEFATTNAPTSQSSATKPPAAAAPAAAAPAIKKAAKAKNAGGKAR